MRVPVVSPLFVHASAYRGTFHALTYARTFHLTRQLRAPRKFFR